MIQEMSRFSPTSDHIVEMTVSPFGAIVAV
jgi:hypothetical protein